MYIEQKPRENYETLICVCKHCGWKWLPRKPIVPKACPACQSRQWQEEK